MKKTLTILIFSLSWLPLFSQIAVEFKNPSFEGKADPSKIYIESWKDCGSIEFEMQSPVDLQPGSFEVDLKPKDGNTYLGMVTRVNGTYESVCQELDSELIKDSLYRFYINLAKSDKYSSLTPESFKGKEKIEGDIEYFDFIQNTVLKIWGESSFCLKEELLFETMEIDHILWKEYDIRFSPTKSDYKFISLEAYYPNESNYTRGNLMLDFIH